MTNKTTNPVDILNTSQWFLKHHNAINLLVSCGWLNPNFSELQLQELKTIVSKFLDMCDLYSLKDQVINGDITTYTQLCERAGVLHIDNPLD